MLSQFQEAFCNLDDHERLQTRCCLTIKILRMILPLSFQSLSPEIRKELLQKKAMYLFTRQEPKFVVDVFQALHDRIEVYSHRDKHFQVLRSQKENE